MKPTTTGDAVMHRGGFLSALDCDWSIRGKALAGLSAACGAALLCAVSASAAPTPLTDEYSITPTITPVVGGYKLDFAVTNNNQGSGPMEGLDGFRVAIPKTAALSAFSEPAPYYGSPGFWGASVQPMGGPNGASQMWLQFWGADPHAVYPVGTTAHFSFITSEIIMPAIELQLWTYWGPTVPNEPHVTTWYGMSYTAYVTDFQSGIGGPPEPPPEPPGDPEEPVHMPEPTTLAVLGGCGVALLMRRRK